MLKTNVRQTNVRYGGMGKVIAQVASDYYTYPKKEFVNSVQSHAVPRQQAKLRIVDEVYLAELQRQQDAPGLSLDMQNPTEDNLACFIAEMPDWINQHEDTDIVDFPRRSAFLRKTNLKENSVTASLLTCGEKFSETMQKQSVLVDTGEVVNVNGGKKSIVVAARKVIGTVMLLMIIALGGYTVGSIAASYEKQPEPVYISRQPSVLVE